MEDKTEIEPEFINKLNNASSGDLASLKRSSGSILTESEGNYGIFYKLLPPYITKPIEEEIYFIVACLFPLNEYSLKGNFGKTMFLTKMRISTETINLRFNRLLNCKVDSSSMSSIRELSFLLRQCVKLANSQEIGVDWLQLLYDLKRWNSTSKFVQRQWARSYFYQKQETEEKSE